MADNFVVEYLDTDAVGNVVPVYWDPNQNVVVADPGKAEVITPSDFEIIKRGGGDSGDSGFAEAPYREQPRTIANNFGYEKKPMLVKAMGFLPGPAGIVGKAANVAMNVNNKVAVDQAREVLGLEPTGKLAGLKDNKGQVANVGINGENYSVGFEALDPKGRTNLTPEEARKRSAMFGMSELSKAQNKEAIKDFKADKKSTVMDLVDPSKVGNGNNSIKSGVGAEAGASTNIFDGSTPQLNGESMAKGLGLAGVSKTFNDLMTNGINYDHPERGPVTQGLTQRTVETMDALAGQQPGGINVTSAFRSPSVNAAVGGATNSLHSQGKAFDISTAGLTDAQKRDLVERAVMSGAEEIGTYSDNSLHIAPEARFDPLSTQNTGGVTGMYERSRYNYKNAPDWFKQGLETSQLAPIPGERPPAPSTIEENPQSIARNPFDSIMTDRQVNTASGLMSPMSNNFAPVDELRTTSNTGFSPVSVKNVNGVDPTRFSNITPEERSLMASTLAGEIDQRRTNLATEQGISEARGILSTIENRAAKYGSITDAITAPGQYSTWGTNKAANIARTNYANTPGVFDSIVDNYVADPNSNMGFTNYHADYVNPGWSGAMTGRQTIGPHTFGSLPGYSRPTTPTKSIGMLDPMAVSNAAQQSAFNTQRVQTTPKTLDTVTQGFTRTPEVKSTTSLDRTTGGGTSTSYGGSGNSSGRSDRDSGGSSGGMSGGQTGSKSGGGRGAGGSTKDRTSKDDKDK